MAFWGDVHGMEFHCAQSGWVTGSGDCFYAFVGLREIVVSTIITHCEQHYTLGPMVYLRLA